jgi:MoxR-like ATPase
MVSPKHRAQFISTFIDKTAKNASVYKSKEGLLESNRIILDFFRSQLKSDPELLSQLESAKLNEHFLTRVVSIAVYQPEVRPIWDINVKPTNEKEQYWTYAPGEDASEWEELYKDGLMAIGWGFLGDLKQYRSKDQIRKKMEDHYKKKGPHTNRTLACYEFLKKIKIGDVIFAKKGQKKVIGYGIVESDYFFDTNRKKYQHVRKVHWETKGEWDVGDDKIALKTLTNITKYKNFVERLKVLVNFDKKESANYWWLIANPQIWKFYDYDVGQHQIYTNRNEKGNKSRIFEHFKKVKPDDLIFCYSATPDKELVGKSKVTRALHQTEEGEGFEFEIIEKFDKTISWSEIQETNKLKSSEPILHNNQGSLFKLNKEEFEVIQKMVADKNDSIQKKRIWEEFKISLAVTNFGNKFEIKSLHFENKDQIENKITNALNTGKHIILIGPPGTGKSKLAKEICEFHCGKNRYIMSTATSDWSTFETIGGYRPDSEGELHFNTGIFLKCFQNKNGIPQNFWLIIDEINRADIDKAFGSLFSSLTGDNVSLPFDIEGKQIDLIGDPHNETKITKNNFIIHPHWRIIATMNTFDKTSLYEMSYAFMRRFAFIPIDVPTKINSELIEKFIDKWGYEKDENICADLSEIWKIINSKRKIGPAIIEDLYNYSKTGTESDYSSGIIMYVLPQFEGLVEDTQIEFIKQILELDSVNNKEELKNFASEFFGIDRRKFN